MAEKVIFDLKFNKNYMRLLINFTLSIFYDILIPKNNKPQLYIYNMHNICLPRFQIFKDIKSINTTSASTE